MALQTALTKRLGLRYPVIAAPLRAVAQLLIFWLLWLAKVQWGSSPSCICRSPKYDKFFPAISLRQVQATDLASI